MPEIPWGILVVAYVPWLLAISGAFYLGLRGVRALERRSQARAEMASLEERLLRLEESIGTMTDRLNRLASSEAGGRPRLLAPPVRSPRRADVRHATGHGLSSGYPVPSLA